MTEDSRSVTTLDGPPANAEPQLKGNLGTFGLFLSVAVNAPLVVVMGLIPFMIALGNGIGTPVLFVIGGLIVAAFATGYLRMSDVLQRPGAFYAYVTAALGKKMGLGAGLSKLLAYFFVCAGYLPLAGVTFGSLVSNTLHGPHLPWYVWAFVRSA